MIYYLETHSVDPYYNLAFEEYVLTHHLEGEYFILWQNENTIVVGQNQNTQAEINSDFVRKHNVNVVRRSTGGGAVYHDLGNLNYSFISDASEDKSRMKAQFTVPVTSALSNIGLQAEVSGRNDILVDGRKISGTAEKIHKAGDTVRILHHGTLLFDSNPEFVAGALNVDPDKLKAKGIKSVKSRIGNIRKLLEENGLPDMTLSEFWDEIRKSIAGEGIEITNLTQDELSEIKALRDSKYATWEWNYGKSPEASHSAKKRFDAGSLEAVISIDKGRIKDLRFYGDFLSVVSLFELEKSLTGCVYNYEEIGKRLDGFNLHDLFGGITKEEILSVML